MKIHKYHRSNSLHGLCTNSENLETRFFISKRLLFILFLIFWLLFNFLLFPIKLIYSSVTMKWPYFPLESQPEIAYCRPVKSLLYSVSIPSTYTKICASYYDFSVVLLLKFIFFPLMKMKTCNFLYLFL